LSQDYRGPDRRRATTDERADRRNAGVGQRSILRARLLRLALAGAVVVAFTGLLLPQQLADDATGLVTALQAALFLSSGLLLLARWRVTGEARVALFGAGLVVIGGVMTPVAHLATAVDGDAVTAGCLLRSVSGVLAALLLVRALTAPAVVSRLRPLRVVAAACAIATAGTLVALALVTADAASLLPAALPAGLEVSLAVLWAALAVMLWRSRDRALQWAAVPLAVLSASAGVQAAAVLTAEPVRIEAALLQLLAAGLALAGTSSEFHRLLAARGGELLRLSMEADTAAARLELEHALQEERLHDARSTLAAIQCAAGTLKRHKDRLNGDQRLMLESAVTSELLRLEHLIDPGLSQPVRDFSLEEVLTPVVTAERSVGSTISSHGLGLRVHGRPVDTAAVVHNLLVNARRYAAGSPIVVFAKADGDAVRLCVADRGPGIAEEEQAGIFGRGVRGSAAAHANGSGLGLFVSARLVREQGGTIELDPAHAPGTCFVITLPAASVAQPLENEAEVVESDERDDYVTAG
jgi:two-component system OmpR family sensor kinase